jgi:hypothetical protein
VLAALGSASDRLQSLNDHTTTAELLACENADEEVCNQGIVLVGIWQGRKKNCQRRGNGWDPVPRKLQRLRARVTQCVMSTSWRDGSALHRPYHQGPFRAYPIFINAKNTVGDPMV